MGLFGSVTLISVALILVAQDCCRLPGNKARNWYKCWILARPPCPQSCSGPLSTHHRIPPYHLLPPSSYSCDGYDQPTQLIVPRGPWWCGKAGATPWVVQTSLGGANEFYSKFVTPLCWCMVFSNLVIIHNKSTRGI